MMLKRKELNVGGRWAVGGGGRWAEKDRTRVETNMSIYREYPIPLGKRFGDTTY